MFLLYLQKLLVGEIVDITDSGPRILDRKNRKQNSGKSKPKKRKLTLNKITFIY